MASPCQHGHLEQQMDQNPKHTLNRDLLGQLGFTYGYLTLLLLLLLPPPADMNPPPPQSSPLPWGLSRYLRMHTCIQAAPWTPQGPHQGPDYRGWPPQNCFTRRMV